MRLASSGGNSSTLLDKIQRRYEDKSSPHLNLLGVSSKQTSPAMEFYVQKEGHQYRPLISPALRQNHADSSATYRSILSFLRKLGLPAMALLLASCGNSTPDVQAEAEKETARIVAETTALGERLKAEKARLQKEHKDAILKRSEADQREAAAKEARDADEKHKRWMQELDREIAAEQLKAKRLKEQEERQERARQEKLAKERDKQAKEAAEAAKKSDEQAKLRVIAEQVYTSINLEPKVVLGPSLRPFPVTYEVKGEPILLLRDLYKKKDWLGVYNFADGTRQKELPSESLVRLSMSDLGDKVVNLVLHTPYTKRSDDEILYYFKVWKFEPGHLMIDYSSLGEGKPHPDGGGYVLPWRFKHQHVFFTLGDRSLYSGLNAIERAYKDEVEKVETKRRLTEITANEHAAGLNALDHKLIRDITSWIEAGSPL